MLLPKVTWPPCQINIPLTKEAKFCNTFNAVASFVKYRLHVKRGSNPPIPSGTNSSQYFAS